MPDDSIETNYDPKYVSIDDVPISGPDNYTSAEKRKAIFNAESSLELDVNNGQMIESGEVLPAHRSAVMNLATHVLTHAAEEPSNVTLGDMADDGGTITEYSSRYLDEYNRLVSELTSISGGSSNTFSVSVNTNTDSVDGTEDRLY